MEDDEKDHKQNKKKWFNKKPKHKHPNPDQPTTTKKPSTSSSVDISFKPSSDVKGLKFGGQIIVKSFTIRRTTPYELLRLLSLPLQPPPPTTSTTNTRRRPQPPLPSTIAFIPTNFTILAHQAWHTLTLGLGTNKSKVLILVFESESLRSFADRICPPEIPLGEVNRRILRSLVGCELARFKFRKGCLTFYVYAVRRRAGAGAGAGAKTVFEKAVDLKVVLEAVISLRDFMDHTAMLAMPNQRSISSDNNMNRSSNNNMSNSPLSSSSSPVHAATGVAMAAH